jgi:hypothetical protein
MDKSEAINKSLLFSCVVLFLCCIAAMGMILEYKEREEERVKELTKINRQIEFMKSELEIRMTLMGRR